jgi:hypothetical protein
LGAALAVLLLVGVGVAVLGGGSDGEDTTSLEADAPADATTTTAAPAELAMPTDVQLTVVADSCNYLGCEIEHTWVDRSEGEAGHVSKVTWLGPDAYRERQEADAAPGTGDTLSVTSEAPTGVPICIEVVAVSQDEESEPSPLLCRVQAGGVLVEPNQFTPLPELAEDQCVRTVGFDNAQTAQGYQVVPCDGSEEGVVFHRDDAPAPDEATADAVCAANAPTYSFGYEYWLFYDLPGTLCIRVT